MADGKEKGSDAAFSRSGIGKREVSTPEDGEDGEQTPAELADAVDLILQACEAVNEAHTLASLPIEATAPHE